MAEIKSEPSAMQKPFLDFQSWLINQRFFMSKVLPVLPRNVRWGLRTAYFTPLDVINRFSHPDALVPPYRARFIGSTGDNFVESGRGLVYVLDQIAGLSPKSKILDIGSGIGRLAIPLTETLVPPGRYEGLDIVEAGVDWCRRKITPRFPNFYFTRADILNREYNPKGRLKASEYILPYPDDTFDIVCLFSVFTHLLQPETEHYLSEISRVLAPGGRCVATFLLINPETRQAIDSGKAIYDFKHNVGNVWLLDANMQSPELNVAYDESYIFDLFGHHNLYIGDDVYYGPWRPRTEHSHGPDIDYIVQDVIVGTKA